jgi:hypothetical protein
MLGIIPRRINETDLVSVQKWCISLEFKAGSEFKPEEYWSYFEDLNSLPNAEIG